MEISCAEEVRVRVRGTSRHFDMSHDLILMN
jgi:hypothetical protein